MVGEREVGERPLRLMPYGERALLVEVDDLAVALRVRAVLTEQLPADTLDDAVVGARTVLLVARDPAAIPLLRRRATEVLDQPDLREEPSPALELAPIEIAVTYDGEDLDEVAALTGLTRSEVVRAHTGTPWLVGFAGFTPGFAYLVDGDPRLRVPRRATPRSRVPAGSVALADAFSGVYPRPSPGGWQLIGSTDAVLWDADRDPPALLAPGGWVRFVEAGS